MVRMYVMWVFSRFVLFGFYQSHNINIIHRKYLFFNVSKCYFSQLTCFVPYFVGHACKNVFNGPLLLSQNCFEDAAMYDIVWQTQNIVQTMLIAHRYSSATFLKGHQDKLDNSKLGSTQQWMTLTCCQDHILTENIWFVWSETSYSGDERRCNERTNTEDRATQPMEAGAWVSQ